MNSNNNTMAARLKHFRTNILKLSQSDIAKAVGLTQRAYAYYELGKSEPSRKTFVELLKLGCDISWLITGKEVSHIVEENIQDKIEIAIAELAQVAKERNNLMAQIEVLKSIIDKPMSGQIESHSNIPAPLYSELLSAIKNIKDTVKELENKFKAHVGKQVEVGDGVTIQKLL